MPERVLITGGSGFIGTNLVDLYLRRGAEVLSADLAPPRDPDHGPVHRPTDLLDPGQVRSLVSELSPTHIVHLGARTDLDGTTLEDYAVNTDGVRNLIEATRHLPDLERIVFASSMLVCRPGYRPRHDSDYQPGTAYGMSKAVGEGIVREAGLSCSWAIARPTSIWGPWFGPPYRAFFLAIARGRYVHPGRTDARQTFGFVGNTTFQLDRLLTAPAGAVDGRVVYVGDYAPVSLRDLADRIRGAFGARELRTVPLPILKLAALGGDALKVLGWKDPPLTRFRLNNLTTTSVHDLSQLQAIAGETPYSLDAGIEQTVRWLRAQEQS